MERLAETCTPPRTPRAEIRPSPMGKCSCNGTWSGFRSSSWCLGLPASPKTCMSHVPHALDGCFMAFSSTGTGQDAIFPALGLARSQPMSTGQAMPACFGLRTLFGAYVGRLVQALRGLVQRCRDRDSL